MSFDEIFTTIKTRTEDFQYSPFLSSYVFFFIFWNTKMILILISGEYTLYDKIDKLSYSDINYKYPLASAFVYTFALPFITTTAYAATEGFNSLKTNIQVFFEGKTRLTLKKSQRLRKENVDMSTNLNEAEDEVINIKIKYEEKEAKLIANIAEREANVELEITAKTEVLQKALKDMTEKKDLLLVELAIKKDASKEARERGIKAVDKIVKTTPQSSFLDTIANKTKEEEQKILSNLTTEQHNILAVFFDMDSSIAVYALKNKALKDYKMAKATTDTILKELHNLKLLAPITSSATLTDLGHKILQKLFNPK